MKRYVVEFIGTFFLILVIGLSVIAPGAGALAPLAIGSVLMVMVYAGGYISGGHFNPAVTLGVWIRGMVETQDAVIYMIAQILGGAIAAGAVLVLKAGSTITPFLPNPSAALLAEFLFSFALVYVVLNVSTSPKNAGNSYYGLAIGFTLMVAAFTIGNISGSAINPAVAIGLTIVGLSAPANLWIYIVADLIGGAAGAVVFRYLNEGEE